MAENEVRQRYRNCYTRQWQFILLEKTREFGSN